jgi:hypothetical protein
MLRRIRAMLKREDGISSVIVGIAIMTLFGFAVISVDAGSLWSTRRGLVTDTDAGAHAAALYLVSKRGVSCDVSGAQTEAANLLTQNNPKSQLTNFVVTSPSPGCEYGTVRVDGEVDAPLYFAGILGFKNINAFSSSTAEWGMLSAARGLRPIAICDKDPHFQEWKAAYARSSNPAQDAAYMALDGTDDPLTPLFPPPDNGVSDNGKDHPQYGTQVGVVHRMGFEKVRDTDCGTSPGNWGWIDFDPPAGGASELRDRILNGYDDEVTLGSPARGDEDCNPTKSGLQDCGPESGAVASTKSDLNKILCAASTPASNCIQFAIVIYDNVVGNGAGARYHPVAFLGVVLRGYSKVTGNPAPDSYFDFEFIGLTLEGNVTKTNPSPGFPPILGVQLCGGNFSGTIDDAACLKP